METKRLIILFIFSTFLIARYRSNEDDELVDPEKMVINEKINMLRDICYCLCLRGCSGSFYSVIR
jgi:hypothetical protein